MTTPETFADRISRIINKLIFLEKKSIVEIDGVRLFPSEIHLMLVIAQDRSVNAITMAGRLGISKGAVSQTLTRLENKGILVKEKDPAYKNELTAHFTELGEKALERHRNLRASLQAEYDAYLETIAEDDQQVIRKFLIHLETFIDRLA
jgi:DNA-binding MarR family transcriptional regulator